MMIMKKTPLNKATFSEGKQNYVTMGNRILTKIYYKNHVPKNQKKRFRLFTF